MAKRKVPAAFKAKQFKKGGGRVGKMAAKLGRLARRGTKNGRS
jgi:hypothetical protein